MLEAVRTGRAEWEMRGQMGMSMPIARSFRASALAAALACLSCGPAFATGEVHVRHPDKMEGATCRGKLVERWAISVNMSGQTGSYALACLLSPTKADWVLITGASCSVDGGAGDSGNKCGDKKLKPFFDLFQGPRDDSASGAPYKVTLKLAKFAFGKSCTVLSQHYVLLSEKINGKPISAAHKEWSCANIRVVDKLRGLETEEEIKNIKYEEVTTTATEPFKMLGDEEDALVTDFALPAYMYYYTPD